MQELSHVLYYGPAAEETDHRWHETDRPLTLDCVPSTGDLADAVADGVDCLVCHGDEPVVDSAIEFAKTASTTTVVVFSTADSGAATRALEAGVAHYITVDEAFDPVVGIATLEQTIEQHRRSQRERTMIDSLLEHVPLSVYFKDRQSRHVRASEELTSLAEPDPPYIQNQDGKRHHAAADVLGKTDFDLYNSEHAEVAIEDDRQVMETEEPIRNQDEGPFGERRDQTYISTSKAPWYDANGDVVGIVGITLDISERKQYEHQLERQNERLERFASVVSHDLRNPLSVAFGQIRAARDTGDLERLTRAEHALERMDTLIDDLLTLASDGETVDDPGAVALEPLATEAWSVVDAGAATLDVTSDERLLADDSRLRQLFENLFRNAIEHGGEAVTITVGALADGAGFFIADDGPGIPEAERDAVFESGHTSSDHGTGLGLSIVRTIAEAHGWTVEITDTVGQDGGGSATPDADATGARFEFRDVARPE